MVFGHLFTYRNEETFLKPSFSDVGFLKFQQEPTSIFERKYNKDKAHLELPGFS